MELVRHKVREQEEGFVIAPLGDIQYNGIPHEIWEDGLRRHIDRALGLGAWFVGHGDMIDFASPSSRAKLLGSGAYQGPMRKLDDIASQLEDEVYERFLKPTVGRWAGMMEGHHYWLHKDGTTSDSRLAKRLGCPHLGTEAIIEWAWADESFQTWHHHGWGAGEESALITRLKKVAADWDDVQAFFMGHCTKMATTTIPKLAAVFDKRGRGKLEERRVPLVGTGGWYKGRLVGSREGQIPRGSYVEQGGMRPVSLGAPLVMVTRAPAGEYHPIELEVRMR